MKKFSFCIHEHLTFPNAIEKYGNKKVKVALFNENTTKVATSRLYADFEYIRIQDGQCAIFCHWCSRFLEVECRHAKIRRTNRLERVANKKIQRERARKEKDRRNSDCELL